ncbi:MAG: BON domain-containing protein [Tepidisphaeraceae bacterium]
MADAATTAAVKTKLLADTKVGGLAIDVDTKDNVVTLTGKVRSAAERTEAVRLARTTTGVKNVVSKLVVDPSYKGTTDKDDRAKAEMKDEAKDAKVASKEAADKAKGTAGTLKVEIKDDSKETAAKIKAGADKTGDAAKKAGDKTKDAAHDTGANITDAAITSAVKTKFLGDTKVSGMKINVDTNNHIVTLTGTVKSAAEKAEAIRLASTTKGVTKVVDKLVIQP